MIGGQSHNYKSEIAIVANKLWSALQYIEDEIGEVALLDLKIFLMICRKEPEAVQQLEIIQSLDVPRENVRRSLERLDRDNLGLITRLPATDRRSKEVILTPLGRATARRLHTILFD